MSEKKIVILSESERMRNVVEIYEGGRVLVGTQSQLSNGKWIDDNECYMFTWPEIRRLASLDPEKEGGGE